MKKRLVALMLSLLLAAALLGGCNKDNGKIKVSIGMWPDASQTADIRLFNHYKALFESLYPEYEIVADRYIYDPGDFGALAAHNKIPTVFQTWFSEPQKLIGANFVRNITSELQALGWDQKMDDTMRGIVDVSKGNFYGVPRDGYASGLYLNLPVLYAAGIIEGEFDGTRMNYYIYERDENGAMDYTKPLYPTTLAEFDEACKKIVQNTAAGLNAAGFVMPSKDSQGGWIFSNLAWLYGAQLQLPKEDGTYQSNLNSQEAKQALQWIQGLKHTQKVLPESNLIGAEDVNQLIGSKKVGMAVLANDTLHVPVELFNQAVTKDDFAIVPLPKGPGGQYGVFGGTPYMFARNATSEQITGALRFLEIMGRSPELSNEAKEGIVSDKQNASAKNSPILPTIKVWKDPAYLEFMREVEREYVNVDDSKYRAFFEMVDSSLTGTSDYLRAEEPRNAQKMYYYLDDAVRGVLNSASANAGTLLDTAQSRFAAEINQ